MRCDVDYLTISGSVRSVDSPLPLVGWDDILLRASHIVLEQMEVFINGGVRPGSNILKAICLGATAVCLGRPTFMQLATVQSVSVIHDSTCLPYGLHMQLPAHCLDSSS